VSSTYADRLSCEARGDVGGIGGGEASVNGGGGGALTAWLISTLGASDSSYGCPDCSSSDADPSLGDLTTEADGGGGGGRAS
jgi:hypothetical protein